MRNFLKSTSILCGGLCMSLAPAHAQMLLNTGIDHSTSINNPSLYPAAPIPSTVQDNYWIKIASYEPPTSSTAVAPAFVVQPAPGFRPAMPNSRWLSPRNLYNSTGGTSRDVPAYSIFRKCFCLIDGYSNPRINFSLRADDTVQVWLNTVSQQFFPAQNGKWDDLDPISAGTTRADWFRPGRNCVYVLVEDTGGYTGFNMIGQVSATGILKTPASGPNMDFGPCCDELSGGSAKSTAPVTPIIPDEKAVDPVANQIISIAETRRTAILKNQKSNR